MQGSQLRTANKRKGVYLVTKKEKTKTALNVKTIPTHSHTIKLYARCNFLPSKANIRESFEYSCFFSQD